MTIEAELRRPLSATPPPAAALAEQAAAEGLLDVAYAEVDSPLGPLLLAATDRGIVRLAYVDEGAGRVLEALAARVSPRVLEAPARLDGARRQLDEYFERRRRRFELPLDLRLVSGAFARRVLEAATGIDYGSVRTYSDLAARAGSAAAVRAAGNALGANPVPIVVPCHRVLRTGGGLGGYTGGLDKKAALLALEGFTLA
jgi:methylated-DNA-[protein]-cysteine S-methyltransferase